MIVSFALRSACLDCGHITRGLVVRRVDILRRQIRTSAGDIGIGLIRPDCSACGGTDLTRPEYADLAEKSRAEVNRWREARGWPPLPLIPVTGIGVALLEGATK